MARPQPSKSSDCAAVAASRLGLRPPPGPAAEERSPPTRLESAVGREGRGEASQPPRPRLRVARAHGRPALAGGGLGGPRPHPRPGATLDGGAAPRRPGARPERRSPCPACPRAASSRTSSTSPIPPSWPGPASSRAGLTAAWRPSPTPTGRTRLWTGSPRRWSPAPTTPAIGTGGCAPPPPRAEDALALVAEARRRGDIDDPANLADDRVWLFLGEKDEIVPGAVAAALRELYEALGVGGARLRAEPDDPGRPANHGMPVAQVPPRQPVPEAGLLGAPAALRHRMRRRRRRAAAPPPLPGRLRRRAGGPARRGDPVRLRSDGVLRSARRPRRA